VLVFLAWSIALIYLLIGTTYRLSLMGALRPRSLFYCKLVALLLPIIPARFPDRSKSLVGISCFYFDHRLRGVRTRLRRGAMYLVQERQLKTHQLRSIFYHLPPLPNLFSAMTGCFGSASFSIARANQRIFCERATAVD